LKDKWIIYVTIEKAIINVGLIGKDGSKAPLIINELEVSYQLEKSTGLYYPLKG